MSCFLACCFAKRPGFVSDELQIRRAAYCVHRDSKEGSEPQSLRQAQGVQTGDDTAILIRSPSRLNGPAAGFGAQHPDRSQPRLRHIIVSTIHVCKRERKREEACLLDSLDLRKHVCKVSLHARCWSFVGQVPVKRSPGVGQMRDHCEPLPVKPCSMLGHCQSKAAQPQVHLQDRPSQILVKSQRRS